MSALSFPKNRLPAFSAIQLDQVEPTVSQLLRENKKQLQNLLNQDGAFTWENLMQPYEVMQDELNKLWSPIAHMNSVMETDALRQVYNAVLPLIIEYQTELSQNEMLYKAIASIVEAPTFNSLNAAQKKILENEMRDFKLAGINLPPEQKTRMAALQQQLSQLMTKFAENVLDATNAFTLHITDSQLLTGLPQYALQLAIDNAKSRNLTGYVFTLDYPSYSTALKFLKNRELRKTLYTAYATRASEVGPYKDKWNNADIIDAILKVRFEMANLVGFANYAEYSLATKMAHMPQQVMSFLQDLLIKSKPIAEQELKELQIIAKKLDNIDLLEVWDLSYYSEKLQEEKFHFSPEDCRPYFPIDKVLNGLFTVVNKLYGIQIHEEKNIDVWHPDVRFFTIVDAENKLRGGFYTDLYARPHKRDGAWMDDCLTRHVLNNELQYPVAFLTCNFMQPVADKPALLTHVDVLTLFHEFGHCLHHLLTKVDYPDVAGINGVPWDAVEFPSQFMENFCWEKESLDLIAAHFATGEPLPQALHEKMLAAKNFQTGLQMLRQLEFALFDFRLHLEFDPTKPSQTQAILNEVRKQTTLLAVPDFNRSQNSFSHVFAGGYAAGYYSYKWAEVLSADAYAQFEEKGIFDRQSGLSFMQNILETGGVRDPMVSFVAFRGREPTIDALLRQSGIA